MMRYVPADRNFTPIDRALGKVMTAAYKAMGLSQATLSERTGIPVVTVQRMMNGKAPWAAYQIFMFADAIGGPKDAVKLLEEAQAYLPFDES